MLYSGIILAQGTPIKDPDITTNIGTVKISSQKPKAYLKVTTDSPCYIYIDGEEKGYLYSGESKTVKLERTGNYTLKGVSSSYSNIDDIKTVTLDKYEHEYSFNIELKGKIGEYEKEDQSRKDQQERELWNYAERNNSIDSYQHYINNTRKNWYVSTARKRIEEIKRKEEVENAWNITSRRHTIEGYRNFLSNYEIDGLHIKEAYDYICYLESDERWKEIGNSTQITDFENYLVDFSECGKYKSEAYLKLYNLYKHQGDSLFKQELYVDARTAYQSALRYYSTSEINDLIKTCQSEIDYSTLLMGDIDVLESYLKIYQDSRHRNIIEQKLCSLYYIRGENTYNEKTTTGNEKQENRKTAKADLINSLNYGCGQTDKTQKFISKIDRQIKLYDWNNGHKNRLYYSYIFDQSPVDGSKDMNGIIAYKLTNKGIGYYISLRANNAFFSSKQDSLNYNDEKYNIQYDAKEKISSVLVSAGITKKIFRPVFLYTGLGVGTNMSSEKYQITNFETHEVNSDWLYNKKNRSWFISPEIGLMIDVFGFSVFGGVKYSIALTNRDQYDYDGLSFSLGAGFSLNDLSFPRSEYYFAYNFDIPSPGYLDFARNSSLFGFSFGKVSNGFYFSFRANKLIFESNPQYKRFEYDEENGRSSSEKLYNQLEKGNLFATLGYSVRVLYPVSIYFGGGVAFQKELETDIESKNYGSVVEKWNFNPEIGINYSISHVLLRGGINIPNFKTKNNNTYYSLGIGYIW
jgi:opacity protein-like surface antigen